VSDWRLVVLGTAQDGGLPHPGCSCARCDAVHRGEREPARVACLGLTDGERSYLFDATPDLPAQMRELGGRLDGVFLTHAHMGHVLGLAYLGREALAVRDLPVYATPAMQSFLRGNAPWSALEAGGHVLLRDNAAVALDGVAVTAVQVPHRHEFTDTVAYRIRGPRGRALYLPDIDDWDAWERDVAEEVAAVDRAFLDATFLTADELPHRAIEEIRHPLVTDTMERLAGLAERVRFIHMNHTNPLHDDPGTAARRGFGVARRGDTFEI
jgi:pyrroloquinoline quinone biosynthesis protein B